VTTDQAEAVRANPLEDPASLQDRLAIATVVGVPLDIDQVEMLFTSLLIQATRAMTEAGADQPGSFERSATFGRSFLAAYAVRIGERLTPRRHECAPVALIQNRGRCSEPVRYPDRMQRVALLT
jgi:hypothetical protein